MIIFSLLAILTVLLIYLLVNWLYLKTNAYKNQILTLRNILNGVPEKNKFVNFGSTYTMYAFNSYDELKINAFSFAMDAQSLEIDNIMLHKYADHIDDGAIVVFGLAACVPFYRYQMTSNKSVYYKFLSKQEIPNFNWWQACRYAFPIGIKSWRQLKALLLDEDLMNNIVDKFPVVCSDDEARYNMRAMAEGWIKMFELNDLKQHFSGEINRRNLDFNSKLLCEMVSYCKEKKWNPVFVITPFSENLNSFFGDEFIKSGLYKLMELAIKEFDVPVYDYREHYAFQKDKAAFIDGGFRMSKYGSVKFLRILMSDINSSLLKNEYLKKWE